MCLILGFLGLIFVKMSLFVVFVCLVLFVRPEWILFGDETAVRMATSYWDYDLNSASNRHFAADENILAFFSFFSFANCFKKKKGEEGEEVQQLNAVWMWLSGFCISVFSGLK